MRDRRGGPGARWFWGESEFPHADRRVGWAARGLCSFLWLLFVLGRARIVSGGSFRTRAVSQPGNWEGIAGIGRAHCAPRKLLRSPLGSARLEREGDPAVQIFGSGVSCSMAAGHTNQ